MTYVWAHRMLRNADALPLAHYFWVLRSHCSYSGKICHVHSRLLTKWWRRRLFIRQLRMDRITVAELRKLIDDGQEIVILDVRPKEIRAQEGSIPGAVSAHPGDINPALKTYPCDMEIVVYCACPNEESAATAAKHLRKAGFKKIRPLLGGIDARVQAGHPIERPS
jgi:rhodanese-related sulfurtransferase